mmetsp:Transcript_27747/g.74676  ORF Transcript_27747/g.74676 Transcript_27747/m.74676 type:complete len:124 (-) Transcript_27747:729-1100(-)
MSHTHAAETAVPSADDLDLVCWAGDAPPAADLEKVFYEGYVQERRPQPRYAFDAYGYGGLVSDFGLGMDATLDWILDHAYNSWGAPNKWHPATNFGMMIEFRMWGSDIPVVSGFVEGSFGYLP